MTSLFGSILRKVVDPILLRPHGRRGFMRLINTKGRLLDMGCGNNSPYYVKRDHPKIYYCGVDIGDYNQTQPNLADEYIITTPEAFPDTVSDMGRVFDAIISSHNLEHCNDRGRTLEAMARVLKKGGGLYLSFPSKNSVKFPSRYGTLNYYDDPTHKDTPPDLDQTVEILRQNGMEILFASDSYKPPLMYLIGFLYERKSKKDKENKPGTWAYWGFEAIIWARKK